MQRSCADVNSRYKRKCRSAEGVLYFIHYSEIGTLRGLKTVQKLQDAVPPSSLFFSVRVLCAGSIDLVPLPDSSATLLTAHNFYLYHCPAVPGLSLSHFL